MSHPNKRILLTALVGWTLWISGDNRVQAEDALLWNTNANRVTADIQGLSLLRVLEAVSQATGWRVYVESNTTLTVSAKFNDLPSGEALRALLRDLNFALVPQTNANSRLYVFRSSQKNATQLVQPAELASAPAEAAQTVATELLVTLKPGANIDALARLLGARVTGRMEDLRTYRLEFESEAAAKAARKALESNPDVASIDSNFIIDPPHPTIPLEGTVARNVNLQLKEPSGDCRVIVGVIDTAVGSLGRNLDQFLLPAISVVGEAQSPSELTHGPAMVQTLFRSIEATTGGQTSVKILPVDVYGNNRTTTTFDVAQGIAQAINAGANIINLSLGSAADSTLLHTMIQRASKQGVVFFGAAGNEPVTAPVYPAAYPEVIAVTAADRNGQIASYANRGNFVDMMAPGTSVVPYNGSSYVITGTSAAAAFASGLAAGLADSTKNCPSQVIPTLRNKFGVNQAAIP